MSATPKLSPLVARSPLRVSILRLGERVVFSDTYTNGAGQWDVPQGDGSLAVVDDSLQVELGTVDTVITPTETVEVTPGTTYQVELDVEANGGTVGVTVDGAAVVAETSETGIIEGAFTADESGLCDVEVTIGGAEGAVVEISAIKVKLF